MTMMIQATGCAGLGSMCLSGGGGEVVSEGGVEVIVNALHSFTTTLPLCRVALKALYHTAVIAGDQLIQTKWTWGDEA